MANAVFFHHHIIIKKSFFTSKAYYAPTQSRLWAKALDYSPSEGERLEKLLNMPLDKMANELQHKDKPIAGAIGSFRLEICLSKDRQFCALQLFRFTNYSYHSVFGPRFYEGQDSELVSKLF